MIITKIINKISKVGDGSSITLIFSNIIIIVDVKIISVKIRNRRKIKFFVFVTRDLGLNVGVIKRFKRHNRVIKVWDTVIRKIINEVMQPLTQGMADVFENIVGMINKILQKKKINRKLITDRIETISWGGED